MLTALIRASHTATYVVKEEESKIVLQGEVADTQELYNMTH